ncbi:Bcr/CflA family multidrug efflux MFS transporter [Gallaecimonas sp. GXIMD4217]|uniref:Bcr/CflA family multidrug efflux MFS transporter n=1 Tax=Gallaecimonas sp. GXIMD4217 TaxID=3131927 RepID=UPI00311B17F4
MTKTPFSLLLTLGLVAMLTPLAIDMYLPSLPGIARDLGVDPSQVQATVSAYVGGFALGQLLLGPVADAIGRRPVILGGTLLFTVLSVACALASDIQMLQLIRVLQGMMGAASSVVIYALLRDLIDDPNELSRLLSTITLVITLAPLLAPLIGGYVLLVAPWQGIFWLLALAALAAVALVWWRIPETLKVRRPLALGQTLKDFGLLLANPRALGLILCAAFSFSGLMAFLTSGSFVYIELYGVSEAQFGYYFGLNVVVLMVLTYGNGRLVHRWGAQRLLLLALVLQSLMGGLAFLAVYWQWPFAALVAGVAGYIGCLSMVGSNAMALLLQKVPDMAGTASSLAGSSRFGFGALVGLGVAAAHSADSALPMVVTMVLSAVLGLVIFLSLSYRRG